MISIGKSICWATKLSKASRTKASWLCVVVTTLSLGRLRCYPFRCHCEPRSLALAWIRVTSSSAMSSWTAGATIREQTSSMVLRVAVVAGPRPGRRHRTETLELRDRGGFGQLSLGGQT